MLNEKELASNGIFSWELYKDKLNPDLLLGNGFTLQFSKSFAYKSLFKIFLDNCNEDLAKLIPEFETYNFEEIQKYMEYAKIINSSLNIECNQLNESLNVLKFGLIKTINSVHPKANEVDFTQLENIAKQLHNFNNIFTTNYDLFLYHIVMKSVDIKKAKTIKDYISYQDYFFGNYAPVGFKQLMDEQKETYKHIYYLHGALFLFKEDGNDIKLIKNNNEELIDLISFEINSDRFPTFITEGDSKLKLKSIKENFYLSFCLRKLKDANAPILIFGNSLSEFDKHIINALKENHNTLFYALYTKGKNEVELRNEKYNILSKFNGTKVEVTFIDSKTVFKL
ncbi:DUF4917 family protein [Flavobacterium sedimenticola]|uniref:DUF4917 family protein n=1 Tax=Flavobacterium sedimenticola TaxID=3043286 RepID=A0ABT6XQF0_9FLAO|nr:DUF4917 family protein [Flavobacterium sedimenticola]MDI9257301.1 DUF4917 family protein [Flavobacterium sedimenticola]